MPPERGVTHRYYRITGSQDNLRIKLPPKTVGFGFISCQNACKVQHDAPNSAIASPLVDGLSRDMPATTEKPINYAEGGDVIRMSVASGTVGEVVLIVEGEDLPDSLTINETA